MRLLTTLILLFSSHKSIWCDKVTSIPIAEPTKIGYAPHWDAENGRLLFTDLNDENARICQYNFKSSKTYCVTIPGEQYASAIIPVRGCNDKFVVALRRSIKVIEWNGKSKEVSVTKEIYKCQSSNFMGMAKADDSGRLYFGTYGTALFSSEPNNALYFWSPDDGVRTVITGYKSHFGLAFNSKTNKAYFMDTCSYTITEYKWCRIVGKLWNSRVIYSFEVTPGTPSYLPFGLEIDSNGNLYVGSYGGGSLLKISRSNNCTSAEKIEMPTKLVGCPTFGGPNLTDIFITSCSTYLNIHTGEPINDKKYCNGEDMVSTGSKDGTLLRVEQTKLKGVPGNSVRLD